MFLTYFSLLMPAFSLLTAPAILTVYLLRAQNAPLLHHLRSTRSFGIRLSPVILSAQNHLTSELLRSL